MEIISIYVLKRKTTIMKIINNMTNTHPLIVHRPGLSDVKYESREPFVKFFNSALSMGYYFNEYRFLVKHK